MHLCFQKQKFVFQTNIPSKKIYLVYLVSRYSYKNSMPNKIKTCYWKKVRIKIFLQNETLFYKLEHLQCVIENILFSSTTLGDVIYKLFYYMFPSHAFNLTYLDVPKDRYKRVKNIWGKTFIANHIFPTATNYCILLW
jgi:hypothetical protein